MNNLRIVFLSATLVFTGCVNLFDDENPAVPNNSLTYEDPVVQADSTKTYGDFTVHYLPQRILYSPYKGTLGAPDNGHDLYVVDPSKDTAMLVMKRAGDDYGFMSLSASPDGQSFAFTSWDAIHPVGLWAYRNVLYVSSIDGASLALRDSSIQRSLNAPNISPTGAIAYRNADPAAGSEIWIDGKLFFHSSNLMIGPPIWNHTTGDLVASFAPIDPLNAPFRPGIYRIITSTGVLPIVADTSSFLRRDGIPLGFQGPSFSSDGQRMLFFTNHGSFNNVWIINIDGTEPRYVTSRADWHITTGVLTPDGKKIAFGDYERNALYLFDLELKEEVKMIEPYGVFSWLP